jgi:hypothetical protein
MAIFLPRGLVTEDLVPVGLEDDLRSFSGVTPAAYVPPTIDPCWFRSRNESEFAFLRAPSIRRCARCRVRHLRKARDRCAERRRAAGSGGRVGGLHAIPGDEREQQDRRRPAVGTICGWEANLVFSFEQRERGSRELAVGIGEIHHDIEMVPVGINIGALAPAAPVCGPRVPQDLRLADEFGGLVGADASTSGARERGTRCEGERRLASGSSSLKSVLNEYCTNGARSCTPESDTPPRNGAPANPSAAQSVAKSIATRCPPAECPPTTMRPGSAPCAAPSRASHMTARLASSTIAAIDTSGQRS